MYNIVINQLSFKGTIMQKMKKSFTLGILFFSMLVLVGCKPNVVVPTSEGSTVTPFQSFARETCYKGVVYAQLDTGNSSWGGAKFSQEGKVIVCNNPENHTFTRETCYQGVVYVQLDTGNSSWGGAMYNKEGNVVTCGQVLKENGNTENKKPLPDTSGYLVEGSNAVTISPKQD